MMELNLSKEQSMINLDLRKKDVINLCMEKPILSTQKARVAVVMDYSGSMSRLYNNGTVQAVLERLLPIAMQFDDNGEMELWLFENSYRRMPNITIDNYYGYVEREILSKGLHMGGTNYAPVMEDVYKKYIKEDPAQLPNYVIFITDGNNFDKTDTKEILTESSHAPIFWQYVGIGNESFDFLKRLDDLRGRYVDNANFFALNDFQTISDRDLYEKLLNEYPDWLALSKVQDMINNPTPPKKKRFGLF